MSAVILVGSVPQMLVLFLCCVVALGSDFTKFHVFEVLFCSPSRWNGNLKRILLATG